MALTFLNAGMIEQPASIRDLSALDLKAHELQVDNLTALNFKTEGLTALNLNIENVLSNLTVTGDISSLNDIYANGGNSDLWNSIYTLVQNSSSDWNTNINLLTLNNLLSTETLTLCSTNTTDTILSAGSDLLDIFGSKIDLNNTNTLLTTIQEASSFWDDAYTNVNTNSGNYVSTYITVSALSGDWTSVYTEVTSLKTTINMNSGLYDQTYTIVQNLSDNWNYTYDTYNAERLIFLNTNLILSILSSDWNNTYNVMFTEYNIVSAGWELASSYVFASALEWNDAYTFINTNSASYQQAVTIALEVSGLQNQLQPTINNSIINYPLTNIVTINSAAATDNNVKIYSNLTVFGTISALSALSVTETIFLTSQATSVTSLSVNGDLDVTLGKILSANIELTDIFALKTTDINLLSSDWTNTYTTVNINSANWNNTYTSFSNISENLINSSSLIQDFSADFTQVIPTVTNYLSSNQLLLSSIVIEPSGFQVDSAVRVTQIGSGNLLTLENQLNDPTPTIINANGQIVTGFPNTISTNNFTKNTITPKVGVIGQQTPDATLGLFGFGNNLNDSPSVIFSKTTSNLPGLFNGLAINSVIGSITWSGDDGSAYSTGATINGELDGNVAVNSVPTRLVFRTVQYNSTLLQERMRLDSTGNLGIGVIPTEKLTVNGNIRCLSAITTPDLSAQQTQIDSLTSNNLILNFAAVPTLSTDPGIPGNIKWDNDYLYVCINTNTWKRTALFDW
jgi:hypothetical protein